jgi:inorganic triphosphatase YgiF
MNLRAHTPAVTVAREGAERELKFAADVKTFKAAFHLPLLGGAEEARRRLKSVYFDTGDSDLMRHGVTLRVRKQNGTNLMGLKRAARSKCGFFDRDELEVKSPSAEPDLSLFGETIANKIKKIIGERPLAAKFGSDILRASRMVNLSDAVVEVALDDGFLFAGERREPVHEIEVELKSGESTALIDLGLALVDALDVRLCALSKAERAAQLLSTEPPEPARATSPELTAETPVDETIAVILRNCLSQFLGNLPALESGDAVEAVHQMRVAIRRLRSALGLFNRAFPCAEFDALRPQAQKIGAVLGEARDWDVFLEMVRAGPVSRFGEEPGFDRLLAAALAKADAGHAALLQLANGKAATRFVLSLERLASGRGWRRGATGDRLFGLAEPIEAFAARSLDQLDRKLRKRGRHFRSLSPEARHALRIAMKHMRYATEFFRHVFHPSSAIERYADRTAALQDLLGGLNDATIAQRLIKELDFGGDAEFAFAAGAAAGWCARASLGDEAALLKAWLSLLKADRYWRHDIAEWKLESV